MTVDHGSFADKLLGTQRQVRLLDFATLEWKEKGCAFCHVMIKEKLVRGRFDSIGYMRELTQVVIKVFNGLCKKRII